MRLTDWFCGAGGATQGAAKVPFVTPTLAANHDQLAIDTHATNFPDVEHFRGDIKDLDVARHPYAELFWASPECTNWSIAKGLRQDYADHPGLFDEPELDDDVVRSRALMEDVVRYLRGMQRRGEPVLAGVVENVVDIRRWVHWDRWRGEIVALGYRTRLIALNSAHAQAVLTPRAPQSRDRLYLAYWHESLGRDPDWDRWLRPACWCSSCGQVVAGVQSWKRAGQDMGRYGAQYVYRCPERGCRGARVEPYYAPASTAIDWSLTGTRIGDRQRALSPKTMARIDAALKRWGPSIEAASKAIVMDNNHTNPARLVDQPMPTLTTATTKALLVPVEGRSGKQAMPIDRPLRTQTSRNDLALLVMLRGQNPAKSLEVPMDTVAASGNHHGLLVPAGGTWNDTGHPTTDPMRTLTTRATHGLLIPYYGSSSSGAPTSSPMGTLTSRDRFALVMRNNTGGAEMSTPVFEPLRTLTTTGHQSVLELPTIDPMDCLFRMLEPHEIGAGMAFLPDYVVLGSKRQQVRQYGNAVTPPVAEVLVAALVECILGREFTDADWAIAA